MREKLNCPNCGQPITSEKCEYCGTVFYDFVNISPNEPSYLRIKYGDKKILIMKAIGTEVEMTFNNTDRIYSDAVPVIQYTHGQIVVKFLLGPVFENGEFFRVLQEEE